MTDATAGVKWRRRTLALAYSAALFAVCSVPGHALPMSVLWSWDKLWHLLGFLLLVVLWRGAGYPLLRIAVGSVAFGAAIELWQHVAPIGRFFDPLDILANATGVASAVVLMVAADRLRGRADGARPPADSAVRHSD